MCEAKGLDPQIICKLESRLAELINKYKRTGTSGDDPWLRNLCREARVEVQWSPPEQWYPAGKGKALVSASKAGFKIQIPKRNSLKWNRFLLSHEIAHTLFYDRMQLVDEATLDTIGRHFEHEPVKKDIWLPYHTEETLCDELADALLIPADELINYKFNAEKRLGRINEISNHWNAPIDSAYRRWLDLAGTGQMPVRPDSCDQLVIWEYDHERLRAVYSAGRTILDNKSEYEISDAGLESMPGSPMDKDAVYELHDKKISLGSLRGIYNLEAVVLAQNKTDNKTRLLAAYDNTGGRSGYFSVKRFLNG